MSSRDIPRSAVVGLVLLFVAALCLRLAYLIRYDEDIDALRFALAVERFDVLDLRPHAPFYPVYVAAAKVVAALGDTPQVALGVVGAICGAVTVVATTLLAAEVVERSGTMLAAALALASPFLWLASTKLTSDAAGVALATVSMWMLARARLAPLAAGDVARLRTAALVLLGVELGVRLSYFPFAIAALVVVARAEGGGAAYLRRARDLASGALLWLVPLIAVCGARALVVAGAAQTLGHFTRWGGSVMTLPDPLARLRGVSWGLWANVLGGAWPDAPVLRWLSAPVLVALVAVAALRLRPSTVRRHPELFAMSFAYVLWAALFQNVVHKPRHLLPLTPVLVVSLASAGEWLLSRWRWSAVAIAALALSWGIDGEALLRAHRIPSPAAAIAIHLARSGDTRAVVSRELGRMIQDKAPARAVVIASTDDAVLRGIDDAGAVGALVTSEALSPAVRAGLADRRRSIRVVFSQPRSRYVDALWFELSLLEVLP